jgi:hypothetical protein
MCKSAYHFSWRGLWPPTQTNEVKEFTNQTEAGEFLGVTRQAIYNAIKRDSPINGVYQITKI